MSVREVIFPGGIHPTKSKKPVRVLGIDLRATSVVVSWRTSEDLAVTDVGDER